jgi:hypothetical protein
VVDRGSFFGSAFPYPFPLPQRRIEAVRIRDPVLGLALRQIVDEVARK